MQPTYICYDELDYAAYNGGRNRVCDLRLSSGHIFSLSEVCIFFFSDHMTTGTKDTLDGVLRNLGECGNEKPFPIELLLTQEVLYLDDFGRGGLGQGQTSRNLHCWELGSLNSETQ